MEQGKGKQMAIPEDMRPREDNNHGQPGAEVLVSLSLHQSVVSTNRMQPHQDRTTVVIKTSNYSCM